MKKIVAVLLFVIPMMAGAQQIGTFMAETNGFVEDITGKPLGNKAEYHVEGTPFLNDNYCKAKLQVRKGKGYQDIPLKLNLSDNIVYFKLGNGAEMESTSDIEKIEFSDCESELGVSARFQSGFPAIDKQTGKTFYQVLSMGKVTLLKFYNVSFRDDKPYGSASITRFYEQKPEYYAYAPSTGMVKLSKNNEALLKVMGAKKTVVQKYMADNNIKSRKEGEMVLVFDYYNTL